MAGPDFITGLSRNIPVYQRCDVVVAEAGSAGVAENCAVGVGTKVRGELQNQNVGVLRSPQTGLSPAESGAGSGYIR